MSPIHSDEGTKSGTSVRYDLLTIQSGRKLQDCVGRASSLVKFHVQTINRFFLRAVNYNIGSANTIQQPSHSLRVLFDLVLLDFAGICPTQAAGELA